MKRFTLIVCTYKRAQPLKTLLNSVAEQTLYPDEILIVDGSPDNETRDMLSHNSYANLAYFHVPPEHRGLTRQRNFGIERVDAASDIVCFLDDDIVLTQTYFEQLISTYDTFPDAWGVGGYIINEIQSTPVSEGYIPKSDEYVYDGWKRKDGPRFVVRKMLGLDADVPPGFTPAFSHGRSVGFLPPSGKTYQTGTLMGGVSSFRKDVFNYFRFSPYFEGYGLYEDADFTIRVAKSGNLYCNTAATLLHYHHPSGRPNQFGYGRMVVRNGWYVWRVFNRKPSANAVWKWHAITFLLMIIRFGNVLTTRERRAALSEALGRFSGWLSLLYNLPKITDYGKD